MPAMSINFRDFDLSEYREHLRAMSDEQLIREGKQMKWLSGDGSCIRDRLRSNEQLKICRERVANAASEMIGVRNCTDS